MKIDAYSILIILSVLVVVSYIYNYLAGKLKIPSVLLLIVSGIGLKALADSFYIQLTQTKIMLEILGVSGLIFIVLEASLELTIEKQKMKLIGRALLSAAGLMIITSITIALIFTNYYNADFNRAMLHAIPLSVISSAMAIPSVSKMDAEKREFVVYESTFSDIIGIMAFNFFLTDHEAGWAAFTGFSLDMILIMIVSIISTLFLVFLLNHTTAHVRFFLTFAIIVLAYSFAKFLHLPSLILVLCFGLVLNNVKLFNFPLVHRFLSFEKLAGTAKELKLMTAETAFIVRTFFFLLFGYSINLALLKSTEVIITGLIIILLTVLLRFGFIHYVLKIKSAPLSLIAPRGLITILLFYSIPETQRMERLSEGVLFIVIGLTSLMMIVGLALNKEPGKEKIEDVI